MAKSWAEMSKEERSKYSSKKAYNKQHGLGKHKPAENNTTPEQTSNRSEAKDRANNHKNLPEMVKHEASGKMIRNPGILTKHEQAQVDKRKAQAARSNNYNNLAQRMGQADAQRKTGNGQFKDEYGAALKNMSKDERRSFNQTRQQAQKNYRQETNDAYRQSRIDLQKQKDAVGRRGVYEYQSAKDLHKKNIDKYSYTGEENEREAHKKALIRTFQNSGYDYNHADVLRHMNDGKENKMFTGLYDDYGGYDNWYKNHSIYSGENAFDKEKFFGSQTHTQDIGNYTYDLGNFTGSKDIMDRGEVLKQGNARQQAGKDFYNSNSFMEKYGKYDFAQQNKDYRNASVQDRQNAYFQRQNRNDEIRANNESRKQLGY